MSDGDSIRLRGLDGPALYVDPVGERILASDAAIELLGLRWREVAAGLVGQVASAGGTEQRRHIALGIEMPDGQLEFAVYAMRDEDGSMLLLLDEIQPVDVMLSAGLDELLESISDSFFSVDRDGIFVYVNSHAAEFFGKRREELIGKSMRSLFSEDEGFAEAYKKAVDARQAVTYSARLQEQQGWLEIRAYPIKRGAAVYFSDITERIETHERLSFLARHDSLTRLPNRRHLEEQLVKAVARAKRGLGSTLLFMDMDRFKLVNDTVGHAAGDAVLVEFAAIVSLCAREADTLARFGGDEFALLLDGLSGPDAELVADRIHKAISGHEFCVGDNKFSLGVSIGMADIDGTLDEGIVMTLADDGMYEAKSLGGERTCRRAGSARSFATEADEDA
jgi:diguanylate cyclase (GGDEF)-like protein/PAS domain S-box-containing protein